MSAAYTWLQDEPRRLCATLTERERDILIFTAKGFSAEEVGRLIGKARGTVSNRLPVIVEKLGVDTTIEAAVIAAKAGLV